MQKLVFIGLAILLISGCSSELSPEMQMAVHNTAIVTFSTEMVVVSQNDYIVPKKDETIHQHGSYRVTANIYSYMGDNIVIPKGATISGTYINDGTSCHVMWKSVHINAFPGRGWITLISLSGITNPTNCNATLGIRKNDKLRIQFVANTDSEDATDKTVSNNDVDYLPPII